MKKSISFLVGVILGNIAAIILPGPFYSRDKEIEVVKDTVVDTIACYLPVPKDSLVVRYRTEKLIVSSAVVDTITVAMGDSLPVDIPIVQKVYEDSAYKAWISGYEPSLDSINVYRQTSIITVSQGKHVKKWGVGVQAGVGATPYKLEPYIGIGISYNIFSW